MCLDRVRKQAGGQEGLSCGQAGSQAVLGRLPSRPKAVGLQSGRGEVSCNGHFLARPRAACIVSYPKSGKMSARFLNATVS